MKQVGLFLGHLKHAKFILSVHLNHVGLVRQSILRITLGSMEKGAIGGTTFLDSLGGTNTDYIIYNSGSECRGAVTRF